MSKLVTVDRFKLFAQNGESRASNGPKKKVEFVCRRLKNREPPEKSQHRLAECHTDAARELSKFLERRESGKVCGKEDARFVLGVRKPLVQIGPRASTTHHMIRKPAAIVCAVSSGTQLGRHTAR